MTEEGERKEEGMGLREESEVTYDKEAAVIQLLSHVQQELTITSHHKDVTPWAAACQGSLSFTSPEA